uniref:Uncharacterized protein n=1 Tax=Romanomermis culicivorax TaxID=13658 RepID=A0A915K9N8_ROMCU
MTKIDKINMFYNKKVRSNQSANGWQLQERRFITINARSINFGRCNKDNQGILLQQSALKKLHPSEGYETTNDLVKSKIMTGNTSYGHRIHKNTAGGGLSESCWKS